MADDSKQLLRTLALLWARLGRLRIYFVALLTLLLLLATLGLWHLIASAKQRDAAPKAAAAPIAPGITAPQSSPSRRSPAPRDEGGSPAPTPLERAIAITEVTEAEERGPRGETFIVAKIGLAPRTTAEKNHIEIRVLFYDLDANNQMHPTDAQVTYQWITADRDWADPAPKYLVATYLKRPPSRRDLGTLRYGGFLVRIYSDGKLQDEQSKPESLVAQLRSNTTPLSHRSPATPDDGGPSPSVTSLTPPSALRSPTSVNPPSSPPHSQTPTSDLRSPTSDLPKGIPIPNKPGFVQSPYDPKFLIDVRGFPPGTLVIDPNSNKPFRVP